MHIVSRSVFVFIGFFSIQLFLIYIQLLPALRIFGITHWVKCTKRQRHRRHYRQCEPFMFCSQQLRPIWNTFSRLCHPWMKGLMPGQHREINWKCKEKHYVFHVACMYRVKNMLNLYNSLKSISGESNCSNSGVRSWCEIDGQHNFKSTQQHDYPITQYFFHRIDILSRINFDIIFRLVAWICTLWILWC